MPAPVDVDTMGQPIDSLSREERVRRRAERLLPAATLLLRSILIGASGLRLARRKASGLERGNKAPRLIRRLAPSIIDIAPAALDRVLKRCLEKDPEKRWQSARDLKAALELVAQPVAPAPAPIIAAPPPAQRSWLWQSVAGVLAVVAGVGLWGWLRPTPAEP